MTGKNHHQSPAVSAAQLIDVADQLCKTMRAFGFPWSMSKSIRTVKAWSRCPGRMPLDRFIVMRVQHCLDRPSRQRFRDMLRASLWYEDLTGINAALNADGDTDLSRSGERKKHRKVEPAK